MDKYYNKEQRSEEGRKIKSHKFRNRKTYVAIEITERQVKETHFINMPIHF